MPKPSQANPSTSRKLRLAGAMMWMALLFWLTQLNLPEFPLPTLFMLAGAIALLNGRPFDHYERTKAYNDGNFSQALLYEWALASALIPGLIKLLPATDILLPTLVWAPALGIAFALLIPWLIAPHYRKEEGTFSGALMRAYETWRQRSWRRRGGIALLTSALLFLSFLLGAGFADRWTSQGLILVTCEIAIVLSVAFTFWLLREPTPEEAHPKRTPLARLRVGLAALTITLIACSLTYAAKWPHYTLAWIALSTSSFAALALFADQHLQRLQLRAKIRPFGAFEENATDHPMLDSSERTLSYVEGTLEPSGLFHSPMIQIKFPLAVSDPLFKRHHHSLRRAHAVTIIADLAGNASLREANVIDLPKDALVLQGELQPALLAEARQRLRRVESRLLCLWLFWYIALFTVDWAIDEGLLPFL